MYEEGNKFFYRSDEGIWRIGLLESWDFAAMTGVCNGQAVRERDLRIYNANAEAVSDLTSLRDPHEGSISESLMRSWDSDDYCKWIGSILLRSNSDSYDDYKYLPEHAADFESDCHTKPDIWTVAEVAHSSLHCSGTPQLIIPLGVSCSGVSETCKEIVRFLCYSRVAENPSLGKLLGLSSLIIEALGNCYSPHNKNTSRVNRSTTIIYDSVTRQAIAGKISTAFLDLERARPTKQKSKPFHIFGLIVAGGFISGSFPMLEDGEQSGGQGERYFTSSEEFLEVKSAFSELGFSKEQQDSIWSVVAAILLLSKSDTSAALQQLKVTNSELASALQDTQIASNVSMLLYSSMFNFVVEKINEKLLGSQDPNCNDGFQITVVDSCGISKEANTKGDLYLNTCAEAFQHNFLTQVFIRDYERCAFQGIHLPPPKFYDNTGCVMLLRNTETGILTRELKNDQVRFQHGENSFFDSTSGGVIHYTGDTCAYDFDLIFDPSRQLDFADSVLARIQLESEDYVIQNIYPGGNEKGEGGSHSFNNKLDEILTVHQQTAVHWIRCIRPGDERSTQNQLKFLSPISLIDLQRNGYPHAIPREVFCNRFRCVLRRKSYALSDFTLIEEILQEAGVASPYDSRIGPECVLLMNDAYRRLSLFKQRALENHSTTFQAFCKAIIARKDVISEVEQQNPEEYQRLREQAHQEKEDAIRVVEELEQLPDNEQTTRTSIDEEEMWELIEIATSFAAEFATTYLRECESQEADFREIKFLEEDEAWEDVISAATGYGQMILSAEETVCRIENINEEYNERIDFYREAEDEYTAIRLQEENTWEEEARLVLEEFEIEDFSNIIWRNAEDLKWFLLENEPEYRILTHIQQTDEWGDLLSKMNNIFYEEAMYELELSEELNRFGYRGVGGMVNEEHEEYKKLTQIRTQIELRFLAFTQSTYLTTETVTRQRLQESELKERKWLLDKFRITSVPFLIKMKYSQSLSDRNSIEKEEYLERSVLFNKSLKELQSLIQNGRMHDAEPGSRLLIEKKQRSGRRYLQVEHRKIHLAVKESLYRKTLKKLASLQLQEVLLREYLERRCTEAREDFKVKFEVKKKPLYEAHRDRMHDMCARDARGEEAIRRHYQQLAFKNKNVSNIRSSLEENFASSVSADAVQRDTDKRDWFNHRRSLIQNNNTNPGVSPPRQRWREPK